MIYCNKCPIIEVCPVPKWVKFERYSMSGQMFEAVLHPRMEEECLLQAKVQTILNIKRGKGK